MNNRYNTFSDFLKKEFGRRLVKLPIEAGFTCPNRDGSVGVGGCIFCSGSARSNLTVKEQILDKKKSLESKWKNSVYCAYFQSYSNTYGDLEHLKELYEEALSVDGIVALAIGTRPDCLGEDVLDLLSNLNEKTYLWLELGLQTIHDKTAGFINRGYGLEVYEKAVNNLRERNIRYMTHLIFGLPFESREMILESVKYIAKDKPFGVKFHSLFIEEGTRLAEIYKRGEFESLSLDGYVDLVVEAISLMPEETIISRITGDGDKSKLLAPKWAADKLSVISLINKKMKEKNIKQGCKKATED